MAAANLLYADRIRINDNIQVLIPSVDEVLANEDVYYRLFLTT